MLEAADTVGGAAVTDEFLPGFRNSAASYTVSLLNPKVIRDMELERMALKVVLRKRISFPATTACLRRNGLTRGEIVRLNKADGAGYDRHIADLEKVVPILQKWILRARRKWERVRMGCRRFSRSARTCSGFRRPTSASSTTSSRAARARSSTAISAIS